MNGAKNFNTYRILFLIKGILNCIGILFFMIYAIVGSMASTAFEEMERIDPSMPEMPFNPGSIFLTIGIVGMIIYGSVGILLLLSTKHWSNRTNRKFLQVAAGVNCLTGLLGILLCIFTLIELGKPEVKAVFEGAGPSNEDLL